MGYYEQSPGVDSDGKSLLETAAVWVVRQWKLQSFGPEDIELEKIQESGPN